MDLPEIVEFARKFAVMVRIQGPDPKGLKMRKNAFHHYNSGKTTLSASGLLLPDSFNDFPIVKHVKSSYDHHHSSFSALVVTVASIVEPFLSLKHRENSTEAVPELISGAQIDVMVESNKKMGSGLDEPNERTPGWLPSQLLALVDVPASSLALRTLIESPAGSHEHGSWEVGWSLALLRNSSQAFMDGFQTQVGDDIRPSLGSQRHSALNESSKPSHMVMPTTRIAFLGVSLITSKDLPNISITSPSRRGDLLVAIGSPFGVLSPLHFFNSISVGSVSNCFPPSSCNSSLLMADIRCLPGMEGSPVFGQHAGLIGILSRPLRQRAGGAEIQLVIPWGAIVNASDLQRKEPQKIVEAMHNKENSQAAGKAWFSNGHGFNGMFNYISKCPDSHYLPEMPVEKAMASTVLVTIDDGTWASGVLLNSHGLILTNAHLLEPWRFGKTAIQGGGDGTKLKYLPVTSNKSVSALHEMNESHEENFSLLPKMVKISDTSVADEHGQYKFQSTHKSYKRIRVRLDHVNPWIWCDCKVVYVSKGSLDIALLQLESIPNQLYPIVPNFVCPSPGSKVYVIGHGLLGPRCELYPSVCAGVVANVVKAHRPLHHSEPGVIETTKKSLPAMLETTAAVHPGGSGGAVVNSDGHMIGLVTSNARHGGGTIIPHLNFSIPCAALEPIFKFSEDMKDLTVLQGLDKPNEHLSSVWALMPPLSRRQVPPFLHPPPSLLEENNKERKGSRFAKFMAERQGEAFPRPNQLVKLDKVSTEILPSKL